MFHGSEVLLPYTHSGVANGVFMHYFSHFWLVTAAQVAKEGILALCDGNGDVAAEVIEDSFSFGYADVYVQLLRGEPTVGALELTKIAPALGYLTSHYYDDESKKTKVKLLLGKTMFEPRLCSYGTCWAPLHHSRRF